MMEVIWMAPKQFSPEFREQAAHAVIDTSRTAAQVARELHVGPETLRNWVNAYRRGHPDVVPALSESERVELERLRKENRDLEAERDFLGKAAAFVAKEYK